MSDNQIKPVGLYARVSTNHQESELQLQALREYASRLGVEAKEYVDEGISGATTNRPALGEMMAAARRRELSRVVVWKLDRLARSLKHLIECLDEFSALGIDFVSLTESFDTSTPSGRLLFQVVGALSEFERSLLRERVRAGIAACKERLKTGPYRRKDGKLIRHLGRPKAQFDVEQARAMLAAGVSIKKVARAMNVHHLTLTAHLANTAGLT